MVIYRVRHDGASLTFSVNGTTETRSVAVSDNRWYMVQMQWAAGGGDGSLTMNVVGAGSPTSLNTPPILSINNPSDFVEEIRIGLINGSNNTVTAPVPAHFDAYQGDRQILPARLCRGDASDDGAIGAADRVHVTNEILGSSLAPGYNKKSYVPHAPYTVSPDLFTFINENNLSSQTISIHNQETLDENELFETGTGGFMNFYKGFGFTLEHFKPSGKSSIHYILDNLKPEFKTIFVHNTLSTKDDVNSALRWNPQCFWATCPNANLYIENRLPDYKVFTGTNAKVTIGTDSLTSNGSYLFGKKSGRSGNISHICLWKPY